jgi:hypothetical protein
MATLGKSDLSAAVESAICARSIGYELRLAGAERVEFPKGCGAKQSWIIIYAIPQHRPHRSL